MAGEHRSRQRGEALWRVHHEAWKRSDLNQREYCEAQGIPLKAFGNWRAKFMAEPQPPVCKLLYRRGGLSHPLSHSLSHPLSQVAPGRWLELAEQPPVLATISDQAARSTVWSAILNVRVCHPSTLRMFICPEASKAQNSMAAVSAEGSTV